MINELAMRFDGSSSSSSCSSSVAFEDEDEHEDEDDPWSATLLSPHRPPFFAEGWTPNGSVPLRHNVRLAGAEDDLFPKEAADGEAALGGGEAEGDEHVFVEPP